jgi:NitT/TauT family transport system permease protein
MKKILNRILFLICVAVIWEIVYFLDIFPELLFPSVRDIFCDFVNGFLYDELFRKTLVSLRTIFTGMFLGFLIALVLLGISQINKIFYNVVDNLVLFLNPIPSIAIFPLCILWFGIGERAIIFIMLHAVIWALLVNMMSGIRSTPQIYKEIGLNYELSKYEMLKDILVPACMPFIISGIKVSLARAWRTAITVELLAGVIANNAGLGWHMTHQRSTLNMSGLLSTIIIIIIVGIILEDVLFRVLENCTVKKWGMER